MIDPLVIPIFAIVGGLTLAGMGMVLKERRREREDLARYGGTDPAEFTRAIERVESRITVLEAILDDEVPGWRRKYDD